MVTPIVKTTDRQSQDTKLGHRVRTLMFELSGRGFDHGAANETDTPSKIIREECLDHLLIINERHLRRVLIEYITFYNEARPHQGIEQLTPIPNNQCGKDGIIQHRDVLGGLLHDHYRQAA